MRSEWARRRDEHETRRFDLISWVWLLGPSLAVAVAIVLKGVAL